MPFERTAWLLVHRVRREQKIDCVPWNPRLYINRSIYQRPEGKSVTAPRSIRVPEFRAATVVEFRRIPLNPAPDRDVIYTQVALGHELFQVTQTERKP